MDDNGIDHVRIAAAAVWDTIWLVARLPGMTQSYEQLLEYGQLASRGVPTRAAAVLLLEMLEPSDAVPCE